MNLSCVTGNKDIDLNKDEYFLLKIWLYKKRRSGGSVSRMSFSKFV
ncbi:hypothetical protein SAMN06296056_102800 [Priestia filamentosa]|nr:hypothetical protein SAMN06296056_102800 [Priestia filamentosa]